uniref:GRF-type domain-containing protein n=1 Tax=Lactuca sativa TaxID=4236 RepID=A0A9R1WDL4_LACSA|nr:hypothetical protein LSAT_V11C200098200 [Lactuca sativa]
MNNGDTMQLWNRCSHSYFLEQENAVIRTSCSKRNLGKHYYSCTIKIEMLQEPRCKFIGWVDESNRTCDCIEFRLKVEEQNRRLKFYQAISWFIFVSIVIYKV